MIGLCIDPTVPVHRQPQFVVRAGERHRDLWRRQDGGGGHAWFSYHNGCWCKRCNELIVAIDGRRSYRGRHRRQPTTAKSTGPS